MLAGLGVVGQRAPWMDKTSQAKTEDKWLTWLLTFSVVGITE